MTFTEAIEAIQQGKIVRRPTSWSTNFIVVWMNETGYVHRDVFGPRFFDSPDAVERIGYRLTGMLPFQREDLAATDWEIVE